MLCEDCIYAELNYGEGRGYRDAITGCLREQYLKPTDTEEDCSQYESEYGEER